MHIFVSRFIGTALPVLLRLLDGLKIHQFFKESLSLIIGFKRHHFIFGLWPGGSAGQPIFQLDFAEGF
jgi:hypothetical protein